MRKKAVKMIALAFALQIVLLAAGRQVVAQAGKAAYPAMAQLDQYLISDEKSEIALARSAAPASISDGAEVMVLGREGYKTAVKGTNGFLCIVERSWAQSEADSEFWNPRMRAPERRQELALQSPRRARPRDCHRVSRAPCAIRLPSASP